RTHKIVPEKTKSWAGVRLLAGHCDTTIADGFCSEADGKVLYEGVAATPDGRIAQMIADERAQLAPIAGRQLGTADALIGRDRINESPLANALTDALFKSAGIDGQTSVDAAFMNTGGMRDDVRMGAITYEDLFRVLPFNNHGVVISPMSVDQVMSLVQR